MKEIVDDGGVRTALPHFLRVRPAIPFPISEGTGTGTENTNGLIRQYLPKGQSMARLTQHIATQLNTQPRKRLGYRTPEECYAR